MKKITILLLSIPLFFVSCSDWLTVTPFDSIEKEKTFQNERYTNTALNGIYLRLAQDMLYGKEMSAGMIEILAQNFIVPTGAAANQSNEHNYYRLSEYEYDYDKPSNLLGSVWKAAYETIANCNEFLDMVKSRKDRYSETTYHLYLGEAIAVRTMLHFDMLRLFGPLATELGKSSVPYYDVSTDIPRPILNADELLDILIADMDMAIDYLHGDPILDLGLSDDADNAEKPEFFVSFRNMHMNYYAAWAIKARMCLYRGTDQSIADAYEIATRLLSGVDPRDPAQNNNFWDTFSFVEKGDVQDFSKIFYPEILFGIHNTDRSTVHIALFSADNSQGTYLAGGKDFYNWLYVSGDASSDGRGAGIRMDMWMYNAKKEQYMFTRLSPEGSNRFYPYHHQFQCIMRLGELYLIAAEAAPDLESKRKWLDDMRTCKGYDPNNTTGADVNKLNRVIDMEFRKDTYGEGQYFFFAKRKNMETIRNQKNNDQSMTESQYVPPLPPIESYYRKSNAN